VFSPEDFGPALTPEVIAQDNRLREQVKAQHGG
jgi:hypothetical protein